MRTKKPKLSVEEQIKHLKDKGIAFEKISEEEARKYLRDNNNYFKLAAYRKNFFKHPNGENIGKYINLDFAYLQDLAIIDMRLRYLLVHMSLDVEHFTRVGLIKKVEVSHEDGYAIVDDYLATLDEKQRSIFEAEINRNRGNIYCGSIVEKYDGTYPIWAFVEIIPFGRLVAFYKFCADRFNDKKMKDNYFRLLTCKEIRNACAHSNCILNELLPSTATHNTNNDVSRALMKISSISKETRVRKMSNAHIQQIVTLLYVHKEIVTSQGVHEHESEALKKVIERMYKNIDYYAENDTITTTFKFLKLVVDNWF